jgi:hypothetical protein
MTPNQSKLKSSRGWGRNANNKLFSLQPVIEIIVKHEQNQQTSDAGVVCNGQSLQLKFQFNSINCN